MRRSLSLTVLAGAIPIVALCATFGAMTLRNEQETIAARGRTNANLAATLVEEMLRSNVEAVRMVAQSPAIDVGRPDMGRFAVLARRILAAQSDWKAIILTDAAGGVLFSTLSKGGTADRPTIAVGRRGGMREPFAIGVGPVFIDSSGERVFNVSVPVGRRERPRLIVSASIPVGSLKRLMNVEPLDAGWTASVVTRSGPALIVPDAQRAPVATEPRPVEMWMPIRGSSWAVRITAPAQAFLAPVRRAALLLLGAAAVCALLLALLTRRLALELRQERRREASDLQRQRMEALGRLTGGVAHDFNNLLTPIIIGLDVASQRTIDAGTKQHLGAALAASERAKTLVSRLLSFSRQQQLSPEAIEPSVLIEDIKGLIEGLVTPSITVAVEMEQDLCPVKADRNQLELAVLNLVVNARDAMAGGGLLKVSAARVFRDNGASLGNGEHVAITVSDSGTGMDAATLACAVDPFFTTKPVGKGTGLGLSMVDGFAVQSGGAFILESECGKGTRASIILPCTSERPVPSLAATDVEAPGGLEILLVDDDQRVRRACAEVLREAGHKVVEAGDVDDALTVLAAQSGIGMVITDFVMPGRSGAHLIACLKAEWPHVAILMVTGYAEDQIDSPVGVNLLLKPFRGSALLEAVDQATRRSN
ncbi:response regulator [Sphingomonas sanguinis]|uniref:ATP-binding protein n=1 Tax=Sphingomonas sanguinis TaxID=33051 RepID=UPI001C57D452|nr:ATP-binding protein [Sphingomonas sanguinis]QXT34831.1 response regulator [Sphingomonas sanguinis]